jgi:predicted AlkP superfamily phosphohydrolase/phosphomutase
MQWGPVRSVARKVYDRLGLHGRVSLPQPVDWANTKAYTSVRSTGEGISINLSGREPNGTVAATDYETFRDDVADRIGSFVDPGTGRHPVARVWRREELFKGPHAEVAPDLLLQPAPLFSLTHANQAVAAADWVSGDHRLDGVFVAAGPEVDPTSFPPSFRLVDLAPTILAAAAVEASVHHSGTVLWPVVGGDAVRATQKSPIPRMEGNAAVADSDAGHDLDETEAEEVEEHLRGLGYLE